MLPLPKGFYSVDISSYRYNCRSIGIYLWWLHMDVNFHENVVQL